MPDRWRMARCGECGSFYLDPRPSTDTLPRAYEDYYTHHEQGEDSALSGGSLLSRAINGYLNRRFRLNFAPACSVGGAVLATLAPLRMKLDVFGRHVPEALCRAGGRLLDVGCGNGAFVERARAMGLDAYGSEPDPKAVAAARTRGLDIVQGDVFSEHRGGGYFDWITMNHVIEHVEAPQKVLARVFDLLAPGGTLWLGLPNPGSLGARYLGAGWSGLHPPFHLLIPSQRVLKGELEKCGFEEVEFARRGLQSADMWRKSAALCRREGKETSAQFAPLLRVAGDLLASISVRWSEETIVMARRPR